MKTNRPEQSQPKKARRRKPTVTSRPAHRVPPLGPPPPTAKQRVLAAWHGMDLRPLEIVSENRAHTAKDVVAQVLQNHLRIDQRQSEAEIARVWTSLIDPNVVAHARPTGLHKGTLFVSVDSNVWLSEIVRYYRREILERLQHSFGQDMITRISFRLS